MGFDKKMLNSQIQLTYRCTRSTSGVVFGKISGSGITIERAGSGVVVCVSDVVLLLSNDMTGSRSSRFKRPITALTFGTNVNKLPCIAFTVSLI